VHAAGTRSKSARDTTDTMSSALIDMVIELGMPIVPVRITGGLPVEPLEHKLEFPWRHTTQDYWIGRPVPADLLVSHPYADRRRLILDAINHLGTPAALEIPGPPNNDLSDDFGTAPGYEDVFSILDALQPGA